MIKEIDRESFLLDPAKYSGEASIAIAFSSEPGSTEEELLAGWNAIKSSFNGTGSRIGFRTFLGLIDGDTDSIRTINVEDFEGGQWYIVATSLSTDIVSCLKEVEWRANKNSQNGEGVTVSIVNDNNTL